MATGFPQAGGSPGYHHYPQLYIYSVFQLAQYSKSVYTLVGLLLVMAGLFRA
jgi:hypothetical protein